MLNSSRIASQDKLSLYAIHRAIIVAALITVFLASALFLTGKALIFGRTIIELTKADLLAVFASQLLLVLNFRSWTALVEMLHLSSLQSEGDAAAQISESDVVGDCITSSGESDEIKNQRNRAAFLFIILKTLTLLAITAFFLLQPRRELIYFIFSFLFSLLLGAFLGFRQYFNHFKESDELS